MGLFGNKHKEEKQAIQQPIIQEPDIGRENVLSAWAVEPLLHKDEDLKMSSSDEKKGYCFCRKCFEVISANDIKCPNCGSPNNRK